MQAADLVPLRAMGPPPRPAWLNPPADLPVGAVPLWDALASEAQAQRMTEAMLPIITTVAQSAWLQAQAWAVLQAHGPVVQGLNGPVTNPAMRAWKDAAATGLRASVEMGLTTAARMRLGLMQLQGESLMQSLNRDLDDAR